MKLQRMRYVTPLESNVRRRHGHTRIGKRITAFSVQIEIYWKDCWNVVVRYDTAHGFAHQDLYHPNGRIDKTPLFYHTFNEALDYAEDDLRRNWQRYVENFRKEV